jgi:hypothetical protein
METRLGVDETRLLDLQRDLSRSTRIHSACAQATKYPLEKRSGVKYPQARLGLPWANIQHVGTYS